MNLQIITACGRSDYFLYLEIFKKIELLLLVFICHRFGIFFMTCVIAANSYFLVFINGWPNRELIDYPPWRQFVDVLPLFLLAAIGVGLAQFIRLLPQNDWLQVIAGTAIFSTVYLGLAYLTNQIPNDIINMTSKTIHKYLKAA